MEDTTSIGLIQKALWSLVTAFLAIILSFQIWVAQSIQEMKVSEAEKLVRMDQLEKKVTAIEERLQRIEEK